MEPGCGDAPLLTSREHTTAEPPHAPPATVQSSVAPPSQHDFLPVFHRSSRAGSVHSKAGFPIFSFTKLCCWQAQIEKASLDPTLATIERNSGRGL